MKRFFAAIKGFFLPPASAPVFVRLLPFAAVAFIMLLLFVFSTVAWEETNAVSFCGLTCHTMPPEYITHQASVHANVTCEDCHMGRDKLAVMIPRKITYSWQTGTAMLTGSYEYPIVAKNMRPALDACENCHKPETFTSDKLQEIKHYAADEANTPTSDYISLNTGGGTSRQGLGYGIHWHIENPVYFYAPDRERQQIPYVVVNNSDGTKTEYVDVESGVNPSSIKPEQLQRMDCITCHNRVAHGIKDPDSAVNSLLSRGLISADIPNIKKMGVDKLEGTYASEQEAMQGIADLTSYYQSTYPDFYASNAVLVDEAIKSLQGQYLISYFPDQQVDWTTHPNNTGHMLSPGCFRCHDGKHLTTTGESVRLECNLCHAIPVVAYEDQLNPVLPLNRGYEPDSHQNTNWINLHRTFFDDSCQGCHTVEDPGGTSNVSFCSNPACHGVTYKYASFDAPGLRQILDEQAEALAPAPTATASPAADPENGVSPSVATSTPAVVEGPATWENTISPLFTAKCSACHASNGMKGLNLTTYAAALAGGTDGLVIIAGDPDSSSLIQVQSAAKKHFGQLSPSELDTVRQWIEAGAPEK
jgi:hypothetical protein